MNWIEKVKYLIKRDREEQPGDPFFYDVCPGPQCWTSHEIEELWAQYPWLPSSYIHFIQEFDGISIAFCRFYGSREGEAIPLYEEIEESKPYLKGEYFPFGRDADGSQFIFNPQGQVFWWDKYDYDFEEQPQIYANSLEEFVGECLMGKRYIEFNDIEGDNYYPFLQSMKWA